MAAVRPLKWLSVLNIQTVCLSPNSSSSPNSLTVLCLISFLVQKQLLPHVLASVTIFMAVWTGRASHTAGSSGSKVTAYQI